MADSQSPARCRCWLAALAVAATACAPEAVPIQPWMIDVFTGEKPGEYLVGYQIHRLYIFEDGTLDYRREGAGYEDGTYRRAWEPLDDTRLLIYHGEDEPYYGKLPGDYTYILTRESVCGPHPYEIRLDGEYAGLGDYYTGEFCAVERPCVGNCKPWEIVPCEGSPPPPAECVD